MVLHPVVTPAVGEDMTEDLYWYLGQISLLAVDCPNRSLPLVPLDAFSNKIGT
jgi:hypothetical protein